MISGRLLAAPRAIRCLPLLLVLAASRGGAGQQAPAVGAAPPPTPHAGTTSAGSALPPKGTVSGGSGRGLPLARLPIRPNVLLVVADDLGTDVVGAYGEGGATPPTPTLDALGADGVLFRNAWAAPNCSPARAMIQTGRHGFRTGIGTVVDQLLQLGGTLPGLPLDELTLPEMLDAGTGAAYRTASIGKWHLGDHASLGGLLAPNLAGYDHFAGSLSNLTAPASYSSWTRVVDGVAGPSTTYATTAAVDDALQFITAGPEPWFVHLAFHAPHAPFHAPPAELHTQDLSSPTPAALYRAMVEALDTELGRLLASLPPAVRARTTVLVIGDNGTPGPAIVPPQDAAKGKGTLFQGGVRVPFIASGFGVAGRGLESEALVSAVDLFPTIASLARVDLEAVAAGTTIDGVDLGPVLRHPEAAGHRALQFAEIFNPNGVPALPFPPPCSPVGVLCQPDIGFGGPGNASLAVCGEDLWGGHSAQLDLTSDLPGAPAFLFLSFTSVPTPFMGGTLAASPIAEIVPFVTDAQGSFSSTITGGIGFGTITYQALVTDAGQPHGFAFTNAVQTVQHPADLKAIRDGRFKLVLNAYTCEEHFYDLAADPDETDDLLPGRLDPEQQDAYDALTAALTALLASR